MARCEALRSIRCVEAKVAKHQRSSPVRAYPNGMLRACQAIFFGLLFFWASKRKVTRPSAEGRNARCVSGQVAEAHEAKTGYFRNWVPALAGMTVREIQFGASTRPSPQPSPRKGEGAKPRALLAAQPPRRINRKI